VSPPGAITETVAEYVTLAPKLGEEGASLIAVLVDAFETVNVVPFDEDWKFDDPEYEAVTLILPTGAWLSLHDAVPPLRVAVQPPPDAAKVTDPVGVPPLDVTVA
jgi:hypothetical protein